MPVNILFIGVPVVYESFDWEHGVAIGASVKSEATAAAEFKGGLKLMGKVISMFLTSHGDLGIFKRWK